MKSPKPFAYGMVLSLALGAFTAIRAFEPPKSTDGSAASQTGSPADSKEKSEKPSSKATKSTPLSRSKKMSNPFNELTKAEADVIIRKGTEAREKGYTHSKVVGTYICKRCNAALYNSTDKFESHCGWPSFDGEIKGSVKRQYDPDGSGRIEIVCQNCDGHLGHVFTGERYTEKNIRHCVNSISMILIPKGKDLPKVIKADQDGESDAAAIKTEGEKEKKPVK